MARATTHKDAQVSTQVGTSATFHDTIVDSGASNVSQGHGMRIVGCVSPVTPGRLDASNEFYWRIPLGIRPLRSRWSYRQLLWLARIEIAVS